MAYCYLFFYLFIYLFSNWITQIYMENVFFLQSLNHPNVIKCLASFIENNEVGDAN